MSVSPPHGPQFATRGVPTPLLISCSDFAHQIFIIINQLYLSHIFQIVYIDTALGILVSRFVLWEFGVNQWRGQLAVEALALPFGLSLLI